MKNKKNFYQNTFIHGGVICAAVIALFAFEAHAASVVARGSTSTTSSTTATRSASARPTVAASRLPTTTISTTAQTTTESTAETTEPEPEPEPEPETPPAPVIEDKTSQFDEFLTDSTTSDSTASDDAFAEMIRQQRAALDSQSEIDAAMTQLTSGASACDIGLRQCMMEKCGNDFTECGGDTDTTWGNKMDSCRRDLDCTGTEYSLFAAEIKADRDMNMRLSSYNAVLDCGNKYNDCIITECGTTFGKCLGKSAGDAAIAKCETIAKNCIQQDSGLASRAMQVFANLRVNAEEQIQRDEERLYELRDEMMAQCTSIGATFDERTFSCVFTVEFYAGDDATLFASKKAYAGDVFDCTPNWFGIDVTTFMENAYRLTREQTSASAAMLGSGLGVAAGAITSGAIDRAIDRHKADRAVDKAEKEHEENFGDTAKDNDKTKDENKKSEGNKGQTSKGDTEERTEAIQEKMKSEHSQISQNNLNESIKPTLEKPKDIPELKKRPTTSGDATD